MEGNTVESQVEPKHYFAALIAIVMVVAVGVLSKTTPPTAPDVELDYYYDTNDYKIKHKPVHIDVDDLPFKHVFVIQRNAKGPDAKFHWRGEWYTTNLFEEDMASKELGKEITDSNKRYLVAFVIGDEDVTKFFNDEVQAYTFAEMVEGTVTEYTSNGT